MVTLDDIYAARQRIMGRVHVTPLLSSHTLGGRVGAEVCLKAENMQKTGSFKARGALNKIEQLSDDEKARGIITVSAGNHAQGVAWAAAAAGVKATVVMAETATPSKVAAAREYGATVLLYGPSAVESFAEMDRLRALHGLTLVHPFDDPAVIAGQGTVALEVLGAWPELGTGEGDTAIVPVGGGGLIAGMAVALKALRPSLRIVGVEPVGASSMVASLEVGHAVHLTHVDTVADGLAAPFAGDLTYSLVQRYVDEIVTLDDATILNGLHFLLERAKLLTEPAGSAAAAALLSGAVRVAAGARVVVTVSGGNIDLNRLQDYLARVGPQE